MARDIIARAVAQSNTSRLPLMTGSTPRLGFAGDSFLGFGIDVRPTTGAAATYPSAAQPTTSVSVSIPNTTIASWVRFALRERAHSDQYLRTDTPGSTTADLINIQLPVLQSLAKKPHVIIVNSGTNDTNQQLAGGVAQQVANARAFITAANTFGASVVWLSVIPKNTWNAAQLQRAEEFNRQMWRMSREGSGLRLIFADIRPAVVDYSTGLSQSALVVSDGWHPSVLGAQTIANYLMTNYLDRLFPVAGDLLSIGAQDNYDATLCPTGNMLSNGLFAGNSSGYATGWGGYAQTFTLSASKGTDATLTTLPTQIIGISGTADGSVGYLAPTSLTLPSDLKAGDVIVASVEVNASSLAAIRSIEAYLQVTSGGIQKTYSDGSYAGISGYNGGNLPSTFKALLRTPPMTLEGAVTQQLFRVRIGVGPSGTLGGSVACSRAAIRKLT